MLYGNRSYACRSLQVNAQNSTFLESEGARNRASQRRYSSDFIRRVPVGYGLIPSCGASSPLFRVFVKGCCEASLRSCCAPFVTMPLRASLCAKARDAAWSSR